MAFYKYAPTVNRKQIRKITAKDRQLIPLVCLQLGKELYAAELVTCLGLGIPPEPQRPWITLRNLYIRYLRHDLY